MTIGQYLVEQRRRLIRGHQWGFGTNPSEIPTPEVVWRLLRRKEGATFLNFRKDLKDGRRSAILKVLTAVNLPGHQEGLLICNLRGGSALINLTEISAMTDDERTRIGGVEVILKPWLSDPNLFKIVDNVSDLIKFGIRIHPFPGLGGCGLLGDMACLVPAGILANGGNGISAALRGPYPGRFKGDENPGWRWNLGPGARDPQ